MNLLRTAPTPVVALGVLALAGALLAGCSPAPEPTPTPTAAFASEEEAFAAAEETYRAYIDAFNAVDLQDPSTFEVIHAHTTGDYQADERRQLSELNAEGYVRTGAIVVTEFTGVSAEGYQVVARTCEDVSNVDFRDATGSSLVDPDRPSTYALEVTFQASDGELRISEVEAAEEPSCTG
ncbi:hypothetical protein [Microbacterium sp.]|uniref:hypothetical protein n=1 Tax=Microbacterium sp. TaxID=51671 RepID=UPI00281222F8|nr:hypothetical protein [Microbacterium sp.]